MVDTGIINEMTSSVDMGRMMENIVFMELFRRMNRSGKFQINYWKEYGKADGMEVDFVISSGMEINELINVTYAGSEVEIRDRERKSLLKASRELGCSKLTIIILKFVPETNFRF